MIVARHGLQPAPITHVKLDLLKRKPAEATPVVEGATGKTMVTERPVATDGAGTPMPNVTAMEPKPAMPVLAKPKPIINEAYLTVPAAELLVAPDPATADPTSAYPPTPGAAPKPLKPGPVAIFISRRKTIRP